jgi:hypothetical protein
MPSLFNERGGTDNCAFAFQVLFSPNLTIHQGLTFMRSPIVPWALGLTVCGWIQLPGKLRSSYPLPIQDGRLLLYRIIHFAVSGGVVPVSTICFRRNSSGDQPTAKPACRGNGREKAVINSAQSLRFLQDMSFVCLTTARYCRFTLLNGRLSRPVLYPPLSSDLCRSIFDPKVDTSSFF